LIGSRDVEPEEAELLDRIGVHRVTELEDLRSKMGSLSSNVDGVYVHLDLDVLDPKEAIANQWTAPGGFSIENLREAVNEIQRHTRVKGFGIASYDPEWDRNQNALKAACAVPESILAIAQIVPRRCEEPGRTSRALKRVHFSPQFGTPRDLLT
jgi:arginase